MNFLTVRAIDNDARLHVDKTIIRIPTTHNNKAAIIILIAYVFPNLLGAITIT